MKPSETEQVSVFIGLVRSGFFSDAALCVIAANPNLDPVIKDYLDEVLGEKQVTLGSPPVLRWIPKKGQTVTVKTPNPYDLSAERPGSEAPRGGSAYDLSRGPRRLSGRKP